MNNQPATGEPSRSFDVSEFTEFLVEAKRKALPAGAAEELRTSMPDVTLLEHARGDYSYKNLYFGFERFSGQETVFYKGKAVWGMGYSGGLMPHFMWDLQPQWVYAVLRTALSQVSEEMPYRGPSQYEYFGFEYINHPIGHLAEFIGEEIIKYRDALVYHLWYVGGYIK
ncbi:MAG TPA: DUF5680 domain-containing protein [Chloroflexia bacterium]|nr:DUF5680 domain-containing protein [Chloroflexia bacterium]